MPNMITMLLINSYPILSWVSLRRILWHWVCISPCKAIICQEHFYSINGQSLCTYRWVCPRAHSTNFQNLAQHLKQHLQHLRHLPNMTHSHQPDHFRHAGQHGLPVANHHMIHSWVFFLVNWSLVTCCPTFPPVSVSSSFRSSACAPVPSGLLPAGSSLSREQKIVDVTKTGCGYLFPHPERVWGKRRFQDG